MPHTRISDQITTENSFYGIDYQDYIDESNNFTDERKRFSEIRKMKVAQEILPLINDIHNNILNAKNSIEKNRVLVNKLLSNSRKYIEPSEKSLNNLLNLEIKLGSILNVSNESIFKDYKPEIIPRSYDKSINDTKYSEMIIKLFDNYNLFEFNNKGDITFYWFSDLIQIKDKGLFKTLNSISDFDYKWNEKSPLNFIISNNNKKILLDSFRLFFKFAVELNHFKQYINNSKLESKCDSYINLKSNILTIKVFYEKIKESLIEDKTLSREPKKVRNLIFSTFEKPLLFIEGFIALEDYKNQLSNVFSTKVKNKNINLELKKIIDKEIINNKYIISDNKDIKEEQEKILSKVVIKDINFIKTCLLEVENISDNDLRLFFSIFSSKQIKDIYGMSTKDLFYILDKFFVQYKELKNENISKQELNKLNIIFDLNTTQDKIITLLNDLLSKKDSPILKRILKIVIICRILYLLDSFGDNNLINIDKSLTDIYNTISKEIKNNTYIDNVYYFSFFDILEKLVRRLRINSLALLNETVNTLTINVPTKLKNHISKKKLKPKEIESYIDEYNNLTDDLNYQIKMQKKYIHIFEKIINIVSSKIEKYSYRITHKDVQKNMVTYSAIVLNKDPRNIPKPADWSWILNIIYSSKQDNSFSEDMLKNVYEFIENKSKNKKESISFEDKTVILEKESINNDCNNKEVIENINNILIEKDKKFKDLNKNEQDSILNKIVNSPDLHKTKYIASLGISSVDLIDYILRQKEKK